MMYLHTGLLPTIAQSLDSTLLRVSATDYGHLQGPVTLGMDQHHVT